MAARREESTADAVAHLLAERDLVLGLVECGTGGAVSRRLFEAEDGPGVLSDSLNVDTMEEVIDVLELPEPQLKSSGAFSAKAARAAARQGRIFLEIDVCLVACMLPLPGGATNVQETVHLAVDDGRDVTDRTLIYQGPGEGMADWVAEQALELVGLTLQGR